MPFKPFASLFVVIFSLECLYQMCQCQRRLIQGKYTTSRKQFVVYLVESNLSSVLYDNWLCGGALISPRQVLTAAACLTETTHLYVIAGYRKYVNGRGLEYNECTRNKKQRVVKTCVPKNYYVNSSNRSLWMTVDVGVAVLEKSYDFTDQTWRLECSYIPKPIRISYDFYEIGTDVVAFGWGGELWRHAFDIIDHNSPFLKEMSSRIVSKSTCRLAFEGTNIKLVINRFMLCVEDEGNLDSDGNMVYKGETDILGCNRRKGNNSTGCRGGGDQEKEKVMRLSKPSSLNQSLSARRQAICQNDHGGPLVAWAGSEMVLIGIASSSIINHNQNDCKPPSLFTSTYCTGKVINCLVALAGTEGRRRCIEEIQSVGIDIDDKSVDWGHDIDLRDSDYDTSLDDY